MYWMFENARSFNQPIQIWLEQHHNIIANDVFPHTLSSFVFLEFIGGFAKTKEEKWNEREDEEEGIEIDGVDCILECESIVYRLFQMAYNYSM